MSEVDGKYTAGTDAGEMTAALGLAQRIMTDVNGLKATAWILWNVEIKLYTIPVVIEEGVTAHYYMCCYKRYFAENIGAFKRKIDSRKNLDFL